jgi:hypothetical protein
MKMHNIMEAFVTAAILVMARGAQAASSFVCERSPTVEVRKEAGGSFAFQNIVNEYRVRWDAAEARRQCQAFAAGQPSEIGCLNGRRDWTAIMTSVPAEYSGQSNEALAAAYEKEMQRGNGYEAALDYCRSVGAID